MPADAGSTPDLARRLALAMPDAVEASHFGTADFRVGGKIFANLPVGNRLVVKLSLEEQELLCAAEPDAVRPVPNAWGRKGWTELRLATCPEGTVRHVIQLAWANVAGRRRVAAWRVALEAGAG